MTLGADGLAVITGAGDVRVPVTPASVVDTIGAGDTVLGAFVAWLTNEREVSAAAVQGMSLGEWASALTFASRAAAVTVSRPGADPPTLTDLE